MTGGNFGKMGLTTMTGLLDKAKNTGKGKLKENRNVTVGNFKIN
jgi:hypothetical protein